ncbi:RNA-directed DNA polymerase from mobile element jockey-like protein [Willisornis vidua]|uniref:RNA-directed DNA polymerase from mobile element jockey-like protein n=1 Tax=Willisornis vidua TaxID=1566151 RepID=A0ABQ9DLA0_9PASS|nr:RNA-directed DNA polymerase from mobile element jockey-like protein [Willisornis vidua]
MTPSGVVQLMQEGRDAILRDLDRLEQWPSVNLMKFNKAKSCTLEWSVPSISTEWGMKGLSCSVEDDLRINIGSKSRKEDPGNYRPVSLTSVPGKIMEKIILGSIEKYLEDNAVTGHSQHGFLRGKSCLPNLISFYGKVTHLAGQGKPVNVNFLEFSKTFDTVSHDILLDKMSSTQLDKHTMQRKFKSFRTGSIEGGFLKNGPTPAMSSLLINCFQATKDKNKIRKRTESINKKNKEGLKPYV